VIGEVLAIEEGEVLVFSLMFLLQEMSDILEYYFSLLGFSKKITTVFKFEKVEPKFSHA